MEVLWGVHTYIPSHVPSTFSIKAKNYSQAGTGLLALELKIPR